jgi:hypothetical protein
VWIRLKDTICRAAVAPFHYRLGITDTATDTEADEAAAESGGKKPEIGGN